ncbi:HD-GYP domain-containing protein [Pseudogracilibacillus auburnensis]|uniref:HD-GYP domain-containing protein (C-di-GMP phosphodiesterase class II) n=1 Tax=Pseudogracilibacillus auburnensis TaxID=1494959 RepID=A0A2V3VPW7_9BACI|nr:HD domain-containing phosphohydrolase [Pseudogracilibacillus auburnensis]MBO1004180.1 hypothetical protein [Pseudogracilibacillus auburnensis]PXW83580.1 HD-GYP domain-containing protein (c-di-GMP phosphodiesterase class II) [Pseudogracilibacillus auburnensis]
MEIATKRLTPGMKLDQDVIGKSGKPIIAKHTELTEMHIEFIEKFLIETVSVTPLFKSEKENTDVAIPIQKQRSQLLADEYETAVMEYKKLFATWENSMPVEMYSVRKICISLFEHAIDYSFEAIMHVTKNHENLFYKSVAISLLSIVLAKKLKYQKKDWLQIGFAALLSDCGMAKLNASTVTNNIKEMELHPIYSYKMVENVPTLTKQAKMGILQHHEFLDGSGYPAKSDESKIHPYARMIAVSEFFYHHYSDDKSKIIQLMREASGKLDRTMTNILLNELHGVS